MRRLTLLLIMVIVGGVVAAAYTLRVTQVRVTGLRTLQAADVIRSSGVEVGQRILWIRLSAAAHSVEQIPAVERATASRALPGTVVIHITERRPVAKLSRTPDLVVDRLGRVFETAHAGALPVLDAWRTTSSKHDLDAASQAGLRAFERLPESLQRSTKSIVVQPLLTLELRSGVSIRFGHLEDLGAKAAAVLAVLRAEAGQKIAYVDVQVPTVPVVGPPPTPTPAPSAPIATPAPAVARTPYATPSH